VARGSCLFLFWLSLCLCSAVPSCANPPPAGDAVRFDPCQALSLVVDAGISDDQAAGIRAGIALWNQDAHAHLSLVVGPAPAAATTLPVWFQAAAALSHGFYDPQSGAIFINNDLQGMTRAITLAHEVGHAFGLVHVAPEQRPSIMNPGNLDTVPTAQDISALAALWGPCGASD